MVPRYNVEGYKKHLKIRETSSANGTIGFVALK
jgi:hypothetical protein